MQRTNRGEEISRQGPDGPRSLEAFDLARPREIRQLRSKLRWLIGLWRGLDVATALAVGWCVFSKSWLLCPALPYALGWYFFRHFCFSERTAELKSKCEQLAEDHQRLTGTPPAPDTNS